MDAIRNSINQIIEKYKRESDDAPDLNFIEFNEMKKVPLYPDLNDDRVSRSEEIKQSLLRNIELSNVDERNSRERPPTNEKNSRQDVLSPKVLR